MKKKLLSIILAIVMVLGILPISAFASELSETLTCTEKVESVTGAHFKLTTAYMDSDGTILGFGDIIESLNGEIITKIEGHCSYYPGEMVDLIPSSGTWKKVGNDKFEITGINSTSVIFGATYTFSQYDTITIYYTEAPSHTHEADTTYMSNATAHWYACKADGCDLKTVADYEAAFTADATLKTTLGYATHDFTKGGYVEYDKVNHKWAKQCECGAYDEANALTGVAVPTAVTGLVYNGEEQTGVAAGTGYTVTNGSATNAGDYEATATLASGYIWSDGSTEDKTIEWTISISENASVITATITAADFSYEMVIPTSVVLTQDNHTGVEVGQAKVKNVAHPTDSTVISYTATTTNLTSKDGTVITTGYYTEAACTTAFPTSAVVVYQNKADAASIPTMYVNVTDANWDAAPVGSYTATVTFNFTDNYGQ